MTASRSIDGQSSGRPMSDGPASSRLVGLRGATDGRSALGITLNRSCAERNVGCLPSLFLTEVILFN